MISNEGYGPNFDGWMSKYPVLWQKDCEYGLGNSCWNSLKSLLETPYWEKVWTYQKMLLPKQKIPIAGLTMLHMKQHMWLSEWINSLKLQPPSRFLMVDLAVL
jgi:hypothetical protein